MLMKVKKQMPVTCTGGSITADQSIIDTEDIFECMTLAKNAD